MNRKRSTSRKTAAETAAPPRDNLMTRKQIINRYGLTVNLVTYSPGQ